MNSKTAGISIIDVIQIIFITLKLANVIKWSWFIVLSPTWFMLSVIIIYLILDAIGYAIINIKKNKNHERNNI